MPQPSRRHSRKKPAFDPNAELDEMISSPHTKVSLRFLGYPAQELPPNASQDSTVDSTSSGSKNSLPPVITSGGYGCFTEVTTAESSTHKPFTEPSLSSQLIAPAEPVAASPLVIESPRVIKSPGCISIVAAEEDLAARDSVAVQLKAARPIPPGRNELKVWICKKAQDGHSHVEQLVYQVLWNSGRVLDDGNRTTMMGLTQLAKAACVSTRRIGLIVRRLVLKQAIEVRGAEVSSQNLSRTYLVLSYKVILERRKEAGLEWVTRRRGVEFVDPKTGRPVFSDTDLQGAVPPIIKTAAPPDFMTISCDDFMTGEPPDLKSGEPPDYLTPPYRKYKGKRKESSSAEAAISKALRDDGILIDDDAVAQLLSSCQDHAPDAAPEEVIHFSLTKLHQIPPGSIRNSVGFLLTAVPVCFSGNLLRHYREEQMQKKAELEAWRRREEAEQAIWQRDQEALLADPTVPEDDKDLIRRALGFY